MIEQLMLKDQLDWEQQQQQPMRAEKSKYPEHIVREEQSYQQLREQQLREQQMREQQLRAQHIREQQLGEQQGREQQQRGDLQREHQHREQQHREQQHREQLLGEYQLREHAQRGFQLREHQQETHHVREMCESASLASSPSPGHSRLVERLLARGQLPGLTWADCSRLVLQLRAGRGRWGQLGRREGRGQCSRI